MRSALKRAEGSADAAAEKAAVPAPVAEAMSAQLMGLTFAVAAVLRLARDGGVFTDAELDAALREAESGLSLASGGQREHALLPVKTLRAMNCQWPPAEVPDDAALHAFLRARAETI